ncbi:MAG: hypothetical protein J5532_05510 [Lachnospiraceae bacterium]|nr:hypothetical protein [Lachnospiraceae bacterium]
MFKVLNQVEMLSVNGGFYYVPVYNRYVDRYYRINRRTGTVTSRDVVLYDVNTGKTQQVSSGSGVNAIYNIRVVNKYYSYY